MVMKRFPNGVDGEPFYQHRAMDVPRGIRTADIEHSDGAKAQLIGGDLLTLLYMAQIAAISQDPWFSRVQSLEYADYVAIDLDPAPGVTFEDDARRRTMGSRRAGVDWRRRDSRRRPAPRGCTSTSRCRLGRRTKRA